MHGEMRQGFEIGSRLPLPPEARTAPIRLRGRDYDIPLTQDALSQHILFSGSIGSGKTTAMNGLIRSIIDTMTRQDVMVIFDTKGDFCSRFYRSGVDEIISCGPDATSIWNIFREVEIDGEREIELNLMELVNSLFDEKIRLSNAPFFPVAAKDVLYGIMMYIIRRTTRENRNNEELYLYLRDASLDDLINSFSEMDDLRGLIDYICQNSGGSEQSQGVYSELRSIANELLIGSFKQAGAFSVRSFLRNKGGRIVFIEYDLSVGSVLTPIYRALFDLAIKETLSRRKTEGNVYFVIDEFSLLPHLYHISDGINFGRSLGAKFIVAIQNCQQVIKAYGQQDAFSILSSFGTLAAFRTTDHVTIQFVQNHYGAARYCVNYRTQDYREGGADAFVTGKAVEDWEILRLRTGEALVSVAAYDPVPVRFSFLDEKK